MTNIALKSLILVAYENWTNSGSSSGEVVTHLAMFDDLNPVGLNDDQLTAPVADGERAACGQRPKRIGGYSWRRVNVGIRLRAVDCGACQRTAAFKDRQARLMAGMLRALHNAKGSLKTALARAANTEPQTSYAAAAPRDLSELVRTECNRVERLVEKIESGEL